MRIVTVTDHYPSKQDTPPLSLHYFQVHHFYFLIPLSLLLCNLNFAVKTQGFIILGMSLLSINKTKHSQLCPDKPSTVHMNGPTVLNFTL